MNGEAALFLTTGEAARRLGVKADTVLKWIRKGRLAAWRTAGGHNRIDAGEIERIRAGRMPTAHARETASPRNAQRCWEYFSEGGEIREVCAQCVVYRARAERCWELIEAGKSFGQQGKSCQSSCEDCLFYRRVQGLPARVLIVSTDERLRKRLSGEAHAGLEIRFAPGSYTASTAVAEFPPEMVLADEELPAAEWEDLVQSLEEDKRIPWVRIFSVTPRGAQSAGNRRYHRISGTIAKPFGLRELASLVRGVGIEGVETQGLVAVERGGRGLGDRT